MKWSTGQSGFCSNPQPSHQINCCRHVRQFRLSVQKPTFVRMKITKPNSQASSFRFHTKLFHVSKNNKTPTSKHSANSRKFMQASLCKTQQTKVSLFKEPKSQNQTTNCLFRLWFRSCKALQRHCMFFLVSHRHKTPRQLEPELKMHLQVTSHRISL